MNFFFRYISNNNASVTNSGLEMDGEKTRIINEKYPQKKSVNKMVSKPTDANISENISKVIIKKRTSASAIDDKDDDDDELDVSYTKKEFIDKKIINVENPTGTSQPHIKNSQRSNFLHRLLACGGSCAGRRRTSISIPNTNYTANRPLNDPIGMRKPSIDLSVIY